MNFNDMKHKLHKLYILDWLMSRGYGLGDFVKAIEKYRGDDDDCVEAYVAWYNHGGFPDGVWAGFSECGDNELNEHEDMIRLINNTIDNEELMETYETWSNYGYEEEPYNEWIRSEN